MKLVDKILNIEAPALKVFPTKCQYDTIEHFFDGFIKTMLPQEKVIKEWHNLLMKYVEEFDDISCCVRFGNHAGKSKSVEGETGYYKLRRGWLTKNDIDGFEYFFADNFFSSFIYKMALDGFVPTLLEFRNAFKEHKFPYGFGFFVDKKIQLFA